ncbi:MAG TPA: signal peptide peptidase SppA [Gemmataceae bacterium]|jgi:protease-4|nr:signal peptide peptidase SppA [Gemmataceae bacterium]
MARWFFYFLPLTFTGCFNGFVLTPVYVDSPIQETHIKDADHWLCRNKICLIEVSGLIMNARNSGLLDSGDNPVALFKEKLDAAANDKRVKAVVLRINSPGGAVTASDIMYQELLHFREKTGKPVVACMMDVAASGAYYLAMGADHVIAHPTTVTGSIGVIMSLYNASGLFHMIGVTSVPIKSGPNKDIGNPARPMTDEERAILQTMVNSFYEQFVQVVVRGRGISEDRVRPLADGRVYTGIDAQKLGLVDRIGYLDDAIKTAKELACIHDAAIIAYDRCDGYRGSIYSTLPQIPKEFNIKVDLLGLGSHNGPVFLYIWEPGAPGLIK